MAIVTLAIAIDVAQMLGGERVVRTVDMPVCLSLAADDLSLDAISEDLEAVTCLVERFCDAVRRDELPELDGKPLLDIRAHMGVDDDVHMIAKPGPGYLELVNRLVRAGAVSLDGIRADWPVLRVLPSVPQGDGE